MSWRCSVDGVEPRSRAYRLNPEFLASLDAAVGGLFERWEQRYGTAEGRGPSFRMPPDRVHRFGEAERRRRRDALAEWGTEDPEADLEFDVDASCVLSRCWNDDVDPSCRSGLM